jgi:membrane protease YdiL (CAAX protease family)
MAAGEQEITSIPTHFKAKIITGSVLAVVLPIVASIIISALPIPYLDKVIYSRFIYWVEVMLLLLYAYKVEGQRLLIWNDEPLSVWKFFLAVLVLYLLSITSGIISTIPQWFGWHDNNVVFKKVIAVLKNRYWLVAFVALTAGVTEEFIFRGYLLTRLSLLFSNKYMPVIMSSVLFAAMHYKYNSLREFIFVFLIGVLYSIYYQKYRNIKVLMVVHFLVDFISLTVAHLMK